MLKIDLHTHTVNSGDALSTLKEMVEEAAKREVEILGITPHGPTMENSFPEGAYPVFERVPDPYCGVKVLMSAELNILDVNGTLDLYPESFKFVKYGLAGLHTSLGSKDSNTNAIINAMKNPNIHIISHPYAHFEIDIVRIAQAACKYKKLLEVNNSSFKYMYSEIMIRDIRTMLQIIKQNGHKIIINSDAHIANDVGEDSAVMKHKTQIGLTDDLIINNKKEELLGILGL